MSHDDVNGKVNGELISREALLKMARRYEEYDEGGWSMTVKAVPVEAIEAAPAVDAVPVEDIEAAEAVKHKGDLIYRRKVEEVIKTLVHEEGVTNDAAVLGCMVWNAVRAMSAVDAAPVVHGRWIWVRDEEDSSVEHLKCSVCMGNGADENDGYCRHCGAKMDLGG